VNLKFRIKNIPKIKRYADMVKWMRDVGRDKINERLSAIKKGDPVPDDILAIVLENFS
jgi:hypothetical protein